MRRALLWLAASCLLAGCGSGGGGVPADSPFTPGQWRMETKSSIPVVNGATIPEAKALMPSDQSETFCGIPRFTDLEEVADRIRARVGAQCAAATPVLRDGLITGAVACEPVMKGADEIDVGIRFGGTYAADRVNATIKVTIRQTAPTGGSDLITVTGRKSATRLGDC